ncbi:MAG: radical SAM protein [Candidatus Accumulibacter sp.]|nr:radical SAM protein [Accumulibacter sp.]
MAVAQENWRDTEPSLDEVMASHGDVSPYVIIKTDVQRRGVLFSKKALQAVNHDVAALKMRGIYQEKENGEPNGLILNDGTSIIMEEMDADSAKSGRGRDAFVVDLIDGKAVLTDNGTVVTEVSYWPKPDYFDKLTSRGTPMWQVVNARPQRIGIAMYQFCDFWKAGAGGKGCKFCAIASTCKTTKEKKDMLINEDDVVETVAEVLKQPGRLRMIQLCCGTLLGGEGELLDEEVNMYAHLLRRLGELFSTKKILTQLIATAYTEKQLRRLYEETILSSYTADIEVLNENIFNWLCPGKAERIGYKGWKERLFRAVDVFGEHNVNTGIVSGVEFSRPVGFTSEEEALESTLREAEDFISHGVGIAQTVWQIRGNTPLRNQRAPSLEYLIQVAVGLDALQRKYRQEVYFDDFRTCGNHPNTDLARI